MRYVEIKLWKC
jgi:hypothetical protein